MGLLVIIGTIPAGVAGFVLQSCVEVMNERPALIAVALPYLEPEAVYGSDRCRHHRRVSRLAANSLSRFPGSPGGPNRTRRAMRARPGVGNRRVIVAIGLLFDRLVFGRLEYWV